MSSRKKQTHLWAGDWESESDDLEYEAPTIVAPQPVDDASTKVQQTRPEPPKPPREPRPAWPRRRLAAVAALAVVAAVAVGGAFATFGGSDDSSRKTVALPAAATSAVKPKTGQTQAGAIYAKASPAVVSIKTSEGSGTGFVVDSSGLIVTNAHVVDTASHVNVQFGATGKSLDGEVVGTDPSSDLALVRIDKSAIPAGVTPLKFADSAQIAVGDTVLAIGNPFGLDRTQTAGIVSGIGRNIQSPNGFQISDAIQTDAAINPGNSGGPLLDTSGHVIGVNSQIETSGNSSGNVGVGFAVPSNTVRQVVAVLKGGGSVQRPWLGVSMDDDLTAPGARVSSVASNSAAAAAGIKPGDLITEFDSKPVADSSTLGSLVNQSKSGDKVTVRVQRDGQSLELHVTLKPRPSTAP